MRSSTWLASVILVHNKFRCSNHFIFEKKKREMLTIIWFMLHWCSAVVLRFIYIALITPLDSPFYSCKMMMLNCALINCQRKYILLFKIIGIKKEHVKNFRSSLRPKIYWKQRTLLKVKSKAISTHINVKFDLNWMQGGMSWMVLHESIIDLGTPN
jgi:hypothetical protein